LLRLQVTSPATHLKQPGIRIKCEERRFSHADAGPAALNSVLQFKKKKNLWKAQLFSAAFNVI
jgi:hypothetical protein